MPERSSSAPPTPDYSALDEALAVVAATGPVLHNGLSNHAPMASEAMCALGRADAVMPWMDQYRASMAPIPRATGRIDADSWRASLGRIDHTGDWIEFFKNELEEAPWSEVLDRWVGRLAPGFIATANHGVIRTGHAARALSQTETRERRFELAQGLVSWASSYATLPERTTGVRRAALPTDAIARVELLPPDRRGKHPGNLLQALKPLDDFAPFADVIDLADPHDDLARFLSDLVLAYVRAYLAAPQDIFTTIALIHSITGPSAVRPMLPYLSREHASLAIRYAWQASAALYAACGAGPGRAETLAAEAFPVADLADHAIATRDEHAIKFTEVCAREFALDPRPEYARAAARAISILGR